MSDVIRLEIYRFDPEADTDGENKPTVQAYEVPVFKPGMKLLDALNYIKWNLDGTLTYRRSCAEGVCGSDGMNINGVNGLACITDVAGLAQPIRVFPLPNMPVIRDLVVDTTHFFEQYRSIRPWLQADSPLPEHERLQSVEQREKLDGMYECVLCACCTTSCPSWWWNGDRFLGPAALLQADRWIKDSRDEMAGERLDELEDAFKLYRCHQIMNCTQACPKGLNPTAAINHIKRTLLSRKS